MKTDLQLFREAYAMLKAAHEQVLFSSPTALDEAGKLELAGILEDAEGTVIDFAVKYGFRDSDVPRISLYACAVRGESVSRGELIRVQAGASRDPSAAVDSYQSFYAGIVGKAKAAAGTAAFESA